MARPLAILLWAGALLGGPELAVAQSAAPPPPPNVVEQWKGEVVALDPALRLVCVRLSTGRLREFRGNAETIKGLKIGDPVSGTIRRGSGPGAGAPRPAHTICPVPALRMTYTRWMDDTLVVLSTSRDSELRAVDNALKSYWEAKDDAQRAALVPPLQKAFDAWKAKVGDWMKSPHNKKGAVEILDGELSAKGSAAATPDEAKAWAMVEEHHKQALPELFKGQQLVKRMTAMESIKAAHERFKASAAKAKQELPPADANAKENTRSLVAAFLSEAKDVLLDEVMGHLKDEAYEQILGQARGPWGDLAKEWKDAAGAWWAKHKIAGAKGAFASGDPEKAIEAMVKKFDEDLQKEAFKASLGTVLNVGKLVSAPTGVGPLAITAAQTIINVLLEVAEVADDAKDAARANALIKEGKLDADLFEASPLLAAYYLANADTSAVIFFARPFGAPGFVRETEEMVKKARPVLDKAKEMILSERYEIPGLRPMKGGTVDRTEKPKVGPVTVPIPTGEIRGGTQDAKDALSPGSAGQRPQAPTITPQTANPSLFALRWTTWTGGPRDGRTPPELTALDQAVNAWGRGGPRRGAGSTPPPTAFDPDLLRADVRDALRAWQAKVGPGWRNDPRDPWKAFEALERRVDLPDGAALCPSAANLDCNGIDGTWSNKPRDPKWPPCAKAPTGCKQVVLGRFADIQPYIGCDGYVTLNLDSWSWEANDRFIACAVAGRLGATCNPPILIASGSTHYNQTNVTWRETSQLTACGCTMTLNERTPGFVLTCPGPGKGEAGLHGPVRCPGDSESRSCEGPWQRPPARPAGDPTCATPPEIGTKQVVIGRDYDLKPYIGCPGYITLDPSEPDPDLTKSDQFIACARAGKLGATAEPPILIASAWSDLLSNGVIFRQVTQLRMCKCTMKVFERGAGRVDRCPGATASVPGVSRVAWRGCGATSPSGWELLVELSRGGLRHLMEAARIR